MNTSDQAIVDKAIDDHREVVASVTLDTNPIVFRGQLHGRTPDGFIFHPHLLPVELTSATAQAGMKLTFNFGVNGAAVEFQSQLLSIEKSGSSSAPGQAIAHCSSASEIVVTQRRAHFRAPANIDSPIELLVWKVPPHWVLRDRPKPSMQLRVAIVDLSTSGMCIHILPHRLGPDAIALGDRLRVGLTHKNEEAVLDGHIIYRSSLRTDGSVRIGVEFRSSLNSIESRRAGTLLNQIIAAIQRQNLRMGIAASA
jgi:hypothetical protein